MHTEFAIRKFDFMKPTIIFSIVGFLIPGFTAIGLFGFQMMFSSLGLECTTAWNMLWAITIIGGLALPFLFFKHIRTMTEEKLIKLNSQLNLFNLFEYIFLQASLALFFTNGHTLCYVSDGQNGLELVFTAWLALPILIGLSFLFRQSLKMTD